MGLLETQDCVPSMFVVAVRNGWLLQSHVKGGGGGGEGVTGLHRSSTGWEGEGGGAVEVVVAVLLKLESALQVPPPHTPKLHGC